MMRGSPAPVNDAGLVRLSPGAFADRGRILPKFGSLSAVIGSPQRTVLSTLNASARTSTLGPVPSAKMRDSTISTDHQDGPKNWPRVVLPKVPRSGWANAARFSQLFGVLSPYGFCPAIRL